MIDAATCAVLEFDKVRTIIAGYALSPLGAELARTLAPGHDVDAIELLLEQVSELKTLIEYDDPFPLKSFDTIHPILNRCTAEGSVLDPSDIFAVGRVLEISRLVREYITGRRRKYLLLSEVCEPIQIYPDFEARLTRIFDERGEVKDTASSELSRIRRELTKGHEHLRATLDTILHTLTDRGLVQESVITLREGRFVLPVKAEHRGKVKGVVHDQSSSGATLFVEPLAVIELNNHLRELQLAERREVYRILRELTRWLGEHIEGLRRDMDILGELDFIHAKAAMSIDFKGVKPRLNRENLIRITGARHPLLINREHSHREKVVPLDMTLGETYHTLIITGPNAGGKTVALKTVGLLTVMVQAGLLIPADEESRLAVFDKVYADIGDKQSIEQDLSSFSGHLQQLKRIVDEADGKTLVLIDEIGAGTDPDEGSALGMATLEILAERGACTLVTTHHGTLKAFAHERPGMENGSMEFDHKTLQPTYRFRAGIPGSSYAFQIADRLGMDARVTALAASFVGEKGRKVEDLIARLNGTVQEYEKKRRFVDEEETRLKRLLTEYEEKVSSVKKQAKEIRGEAYARADEILARANTLLENTVAEIRRQQAEKEAIRKAKREVAQVREQVRRGLEANRIGEQGELEKVSVGQDVWIPAFHARGTVLTEPDGDGRVLIQAGRAKVELPLSQLRPSEDIERPREYSTGGVSYSTERDISTEVSVRGLTGDEACDAVEKYMDDAFVAGLTTIRVIHGKGTGALRKRLDQFLENHPRVKTKRLGNWDEGGIGVTVVELK